MHAAVDAYERAYEVDDPAELARLLEEAFTPDAVLESTYLPDRVVGRSAFADHIANTKARLAGTEPVRTSRIERVGDTLRWTWAFEADGVRVAEGMDVALLSDDERITLLVVFDGPVPSG